MLPAGNKLGISSVIRNLLLQNEELKSLVSGKIYPLYAPEKTEGDFVLYQRDGHKSDYTKMGKSGTECRIFINTISDDYDRGLDIAQKICEVLEGKYSDGMEIWLEDSTEATTDKKYIQVLLFSIK